MQTWGEMSIFMNVRLGGISCPNDLDNRFPSSFRTRKTSVLIYHDDLKKSFSKCTPWGLASFLMKSILRWVKVKQMKGTLPAIMQTRVFNPF